MARQSGAGLDVHGRVGERLGECSAPAVEVHWLRVLCRLEQLHLARRQHPGRFITTALGVPGLDAECAAQVAAQGERVADLALGLARSLAAQGREHRAHRGPSLALPPVPKNRAEDGRDLKQLRPARLHPGRADQPRFCQTS